MLRSNTISVTLLLLWGVVLATSEKNEMMPEFKKSQEGKTKYGSAQEEPDRMKKFKRTTAWENDDFWLRGSKPTWEEFRDQWKDLSLEERVDRLDPRIDAHVIVNPKDESFGKEHESFPVNAAHDRIEKSIIHDKSDLHFNNPLELIMAKYHEGSQEFDKVFQRSEPFKEYEQNVYDGRINTDFVIPQIYNNHPTVHGYNTHHEPPPPPPPPPPPYYHIEPVEHYELPRSYYLTDDAPRRHYGERPKTYYLSSKHRNGGSSKDIPTKYEDRKDYNTHPGAPPAPGGPSSPTPTSSFHPNLGPITITKTPLNSHHDKKPHGPLIHKLPDFFPPYPPPHPPPYASPPHYGPPHPPPYPPPYPPQEPHFGPPHGPPHPPHPMYAYSPEPVFRQYFLSSTTSVDVQDPRDRSPPPSRHPEVYEEPQARETPIPILDSFEVYDKLRKKNMERKEDSER